MKLPKTQNGYRFTSASEYDRKITLMKTTSGTDSNGNPNVPAVFARNVCAKIETAKNSGRLDPSQLLAEQVTYYDVTIRYRPDVTSDMTMLGPSGQAWFITSMNDVAQAHVEWRITVKEVNGGV
jgi:SPP1 family predicted phage head-tail adaptor